MGLDMPVGEIVGIALALCLGLGLLSLLLYGRGFSAGVPARRLKRAIATLWLTIIVTVVALVALRLWLGAPLVDYQTGQGLSWGALGQPRQLAPVVLAALVLLGALVLARRIIRPLLGPRLVVNWPREDPRSGEDAS